MTYKRRQLLPKNGEWYVMKYWTNIITEIKGVEHFLMGHAICSIGKSDDNKLYVFVIEDDVINIDYCWLVSDVINHMDDSNVGEAKEIIKRTLREISLGKLEI